MPGWGQIVQEVNRSAEIRGELGPDLDTIRLKYIKLLHAHTGRAVIVYASGWLQAEGGQNVDYSVGGNDIHAFMENCHGATERELDLIIHSPGGSGTAAEQIINYLRTRFDYIRALVPLQAKSAATMMALGCDEIVLGAHSELGPIDPQILMPVPGGQRFAPAHAIKRDFQRASEEIARNVQVLPVWTPILHAYAGGLLTFCEQQIGLSQDVVTGWLERHMLAHPDSGVPEADRHETAKHVAEWFGSDTAYDRFRDHGRPIRIEELQTLPGLRVRRLEDDHTLQDLVLSVYHALDITLGGAAVKIVENHQGKRWVRVRQSFFIQAPGSTPPGTTPTHPGMKPDPPTAGRQEKPPKRPNQLPRSQRKRNS